MSAQQSSRTALLAGNAATRHIPRPVATWWPWLLAAVASVLSLLRSGYGFDLSNNAFHIPIVLRFAEMPQFANDPFVLSLRQFVSPLYPLLSLVATEGNVSGLFFAGLVTVHLLTFLALLRIGTACGISGPLEQATLVLLLVATRHIYYVSPVGGDGLLVNSFSHTELARAVALLAIADLLRGRMVRTGALAGIAFALNAFVGAWTLAPVAAGAAWHLATGRVRPRTVLLAGAAFAVPAAPVAVWIASASVGTVLDFDYRVFLDGYATNHFFLHASGSVKLRQLAFAVLAGGLATGLLDRGRIPLLVFASLASVFGAGVLVGMFAESRLVLNLHLLRVDGMLVLLSATFAAAAAVLQARLGRPVALGAAAITGIGLFTGQWPVVAFAMLLANLVRRWPALDPMPGRLNLLPTLPLLCRRAFLAGVLFLAGGGSLYAWTLRQASPVGIPSNMDFLGSSAPLPHWQDVQRWAREATPATAMFLVPPDLEGFRTGAQRRIWVSKKDGATVMWAPQTYHSWRQRREEVRSLDGLGPASAYACTHGIDYVVLDLRQRRGEPGAASEAAFVNAWFEVHRVRCGEPAPL